MTRRRLLILFGLVFGFGVACSGVVMTVVVMSNALEHRPLASFSCWR